MGVDAVVLGSAVHNRQWLGQATSFVSTNRQAVRDRPFWTFSVGMPDAPAQGVPEDRPHRRGRHHRPAGRPAAARSPAVLRPSSSQASSPSPAGIFLHLAGGHYGDFRDWPAIDRWALDIAGQLDVTAANADAINTTARRPRHPVSGCHDCHR